MSRRDLVRELKLAQKRGVADITLTVPEERGKVVKMPIEDFIGLAGDPESDPDVELVAQLNAAKGEIDRLNKALEPLEGDLAKSKAECAALQARVDREGAPAAEGDAE